MTLNVAFKKVFGNGLEAYGFKKAKGKYPYLVRVMPGNEIVNVISVRNVYESKPGYKSFEILGGVATVYRQRISLEKSPRDNLIWLKSLKRFSLKSNSAIEIDTSNFQYDDNIDDETMLKIMEHAFELSLIIMIPTFDEIKNLKSCVDFFRTFGIPMSFHDESDNFFNSNPNNYCDEGLLFVQIQDQQEIINSVKKSLERIKSKIGILYNENNYTLRERKLKILEKQKDFVYDLHKETFIELERRKQFNCRLLIDAGIQLNI